MIKIEITWKDLTQDEQIMSAFHEVRVTLLKSVVDKKNNTGDDLTVCPSYIKSHRECNYNNISYIIVDTPAEENQSDVNDNGWNRRNRCLPTNTNSRKFYGRSRVTDLLTL